jgi:RNA polymerase sigma-70 factor (ECF subfamily)
MVQYMEASTRYDGSVDLERDQELVLRCQAGDSAAFAALYTRYEARLFRFCLRRLDDRQEAEDVTQESFVRAWRAIPRFAGDRRFYPWLTVIAKNLCTDALRRRSRTAPEVDVQLESTDVHLLDRQQTTEEQVVAAIDGELVHRALGRLNVRHRRVLELREGSEWSYKEIAHYEGVEVSAIETLVWRARQALKREFDAVSGSNASLGGFTFVGAGLVRRWRATVARHSGIFHSGGFRFRDAAMAMVVTSAVATSAAIPSFAPISAATAPVAVDRSTALSHTTPGAYGHTMVGGHRSARGSGGVGGPVTQPAVTGDPSATPESGASGGTRRGLDASDTGATASSSPVATSPVPEPVPTPEPALPVKVVTPGTAAVSVASAIVPAAASVVAFLGVPVPVPTTGIVPGSGSGITTVLPGLGGPTGGVVPTVVTIPGIASTPSSGHLGGLLDIP